MSWHGSNCFPFVSAKRCIRSTNFCAPMASIHRNGPPRKGGNPTPKMAPMSPSTAFSIMPSWRQKAASLAKRTIIRRATSSSESFTGSLPARNFSTNGSISGLTILPPLPLSYMKNPLPDLRPIMFWSTMPWRTWASAPSMRVPSALARSCCTCRAMSAPTSSQSATGPTGIPKERRHLSSRWGATPSLMSAIVSAMYGPRQRLTKNPGTSLTTITVLPWRIPASTAADEVSLLVPAWGMISRRGILSTGEK
mmetsp:Transcript_53882/g.127219  ORF Transcript_53882/g.127219 Transcript_53882/m.127219 type:complete len:252 (-) Transcript_53882:1444-2199(-)